MLWGACHGVMPRSHKISVYLFILLRWTAQDLSVSFNYKSSRVVVKSGGVLKYISSLN